MNSWRAAAGIVRFDRSAAAHARIARPASCSAILAQTPCALPPASRHASRYTGATASRARLAIRGRSFQLQIVDDRIDLLSGVAWGAAELEPLRRATRRHGEHQR